MVKRKWFEQRPKAHETVGRLLLPSILPKEAEIRSLLLGMENTHILFCEYSVSSLVIPLLELWWNAFCQINAYLILLIVFRRPLKFRNKVLWITFQSRLWLKHCICKSVLSSMFLVEHALVLLFSLLN